ncbi:hypothetical protein ACKWTF_003116 [Chironomus riparius]
MSKTFLFVLCLSIIVPDLSASTFFECHYDFWEYYIVGNIYYCWVQNEVNMSSTKTAFIESDHGVELNEIRQSDLKPFSKLVTLYFPCNNIEMLEVDLFIFNHKLEFIDLSNNKIQFINSGAFDRLYKLSYLSLDNNICINNSTEENADDLEEFITSAEFNCNPKLFNRLEKKLHKLYSELDKFMTIDFYKNFKSLKEELKHSKYADHPIFLKKIEKLKDIMIQKFYFKLIKY